MKLFPFVLASVVSFLFVGCGDKNGGRGGGQEFGNIDLAGFKNTVDKDGLFSKGKESRKIYRNIDKSLKHSRRSSNKNHNMHYGLVTQGSAEYDHFGRLYPPYMPAYCEANAEPGLNSNMVYCRIDYSGNTYRCAMLVQEDNGSSFPEFPREPELSEDWLFCNKLNGDVVENEANDPVYDDEIYDDDGFYLNDDEVLDFGMSGGTELLGALNFAGDGFSSCGQALNDLRSVYTQSEKALREMLTMMRSSEFQYIELKEVTPAEDEAVAYEFASKDQGAQVNGRLAGGADESRILLKQNLNVSADFSAMSAPGYVPPEMTSESQQIQFGTEMQFVADIQNQMIDSTMRFSFNGESVDAKMSIVGGEFPGVTQSLQVGPESLTFSMSFVSSNEVEVAVRGAIEGKSVDFKAKIESLEDGCSISSESVSDLN